MQRLNIENEKTNVLSQIKRQAKNTSGLVNISGVTGTGAAMLASLIAGQKTQSLVMTSSYERGKKLCADLSFFVKPEERAIFLLPEENPFLLQYEARSHTDLERRLSALVALLKGKPCIIVGTPESLLKKMVPKAYFTENILSFAVGSETDPVQASRKLTAMGYERVNLVESRGQFSVRGGIIDMFPPDEANPIRVELFDSEVDSIRFFDAESQRSLEKQESIVIYPAQQMVYDTVRFEAAAAKIEQSYSKSAGKLTEQAAQKRKERKNRLLEFIGEGVNLQLLENYLNYFYDETETLADYAGQESVLIIEDLDRVCGRMDLYTQELREDYDVLTERGEALAEEFDIEYILTQFNKTITDHAAFLLNPFASSPRLSVPLTAQISLIMKQTTTYYGKMDLLAEEVRQYLHKQFQVVVACTNEERLRNLRDFFNRNDLASSGLTLAAGELSSGIELTGEKLALISDKDIFIAAAKRKKTFNQSAKSKPIKVFTEIKQGDYIVHENHGVGRFIGIEQRNFEGVVKDYLKIKYAGEDFLYIPVGQMDLIQKYIGSDGASPRVNKLTGTEWKRTKIRAKMAIAQMAKELIEVSARRRMLAGYAFAPDTPWQQEFENMFPYVETFDQIKCIKEIKKDMEKPVIMERLLCGDVGYGKTEVAARAAFKCAAEGKQVALLAPTTILANQHYRTFVQRFESFPMQIEMLSRFRSEQQQRKIIEKIKTGGVDVIVGTHRILSKDVAFKDLGLLIIDEEHRFGVQHKEVIKTLKNKVDVLTLSATPIPRTLHMSLSGIRDMSVIEQPPEERYPVQTYVMEQDDEILREVIRRELERDGQVFIVYNRVQGIKKIAHYISQLAPEASIAIGHGQMNEKELEDIMADFMERRYNILLATTIIESGIDIPNANTIIILDSDKFGLSQLYQLRGRVGRSNRMAYAYLFYQRSKVLTEVAEKRLRAIREFTEFGSGFKIAMRDLEIRGAGNLLGTEQSGHMMTIGYELYCKLLEDAVKALAGKGDLEDVESEIQETTVDFAVDAYISEEYIQDEVMKLQIYKKISAIQSEEDELEIRDELLDRFGDLPSSTQNLIWIARIKAMGQALGALRIGENKRQITLAFYEKNKLRPERIVSLVQEYGLRVTLHAGKRPEILFHTEAKQNKIKETIMLLNKLLIDQG